MTTLTTGQAAKLLGISRNSIVRSIDIWCKLQAEPRKTPRSHRRIPASEIHEFLTRNNRPIPDSLARMV